MDLIKIGNYIKACRKEKSLTQEDLAEKLNISPKTVSKWECGKGLPDVSIMVDLCKCLSISVNELLCGEHIDSKDYMDKAEEKLLEMQEEKIKSDKRLLTAEIFIGVIASLFFVFFVYLGGLYLENNNVLYGVLFIVVGAIIFVPSMLFCFYIEQKAGYYQCQHCGNKFIPTFSQVIFSMHINRTRRMKCPQCGHKTWCKKVIK